jgi:hypothetical protein
VRIDRTPFVNRFKDLIEMRNPWESPWKDLQKYILPTRGAFDVEPGQSIAIDHKVMLDGEPMMAAAALAAGMQSGLTSPAMPWFALGLEEPALNKRQANRVWLDEVRDILLSVFAKSNIYAEFYSMYEELGVFGTAVLLVFPDYANVIRPICRTCGEYYLEVDESGEVKTLGMVRRMTVESIVRQFGLQNCSEATRNNWQNNKLYVRVPVYHLIEPNDGRDPERKDSRNMAFRSVYWEERAEPDQILRWSGFNLFPALCPRWGPRTREDAYGRGSPGWKVLGDSKSLQVEVRDKFKGLAKAINPPMQGPPALENKVIDATPGGFTPTGDTEQAIIRPLYNVALDIPAISNDIREMELKVNRYFYVDLFRMLKDRTGPQMTARQIMEMHEEKVSALSPVIERIESVLAQLINIVFTRAQEVGILPPPPQELDGLDVKVDFISPLSQAQKMLGTTSIVDFMGMVGSIASVQAAQVPVPVLDTVDLDLVAEEYGVRLGVPAKLIRPQEKRDEIRARREQEAQAEVQQVQAGQDAMAAVQGAKTLSETRINEPNALTALLGGPAGAVPGGM